MLFQKSQMHVNEPDYVTVHCHDQNDSKRCQDGEKKCCNNVLSHYYLALVRRVITSTP